MTPDISIVMPVDGRHAYLERALATLLRQDSLRQGLSAEFIIVDNARDARDHQATRNVCVAAAGRADPAHVAITYVPARHGRADHNNAGYVRNVGLRLAQAPVVLFSDADVLHVTETLAQHLSAHRAASRVLIYGFMRDCPPGVSLAPPDLLAACHDATFDLRMAASTDWYGAMSMSAAREQLCEIGGFDEQFHRWGYEDYDLARRMRLTGATIVRDDRILTLHQVHPKSTAGGGWMKLRAGLRQLMRVRHANRRRSWGVPSREPERLAPRERV